MKGWQKDIFEGDYVRLISAEEFITRNKHTVNENADVKILREYGGKAYRVQGCKYNGKILLEGDDQHAYPPHLLQPWHKDSVYGEVSDDDFASLIGETL